MKAKPLGRTHVLLILTASEAQYFGIPTESGCAVILRTHGVFFPYLFCKHRRYTVRTMPQVFHLASCNAMINLIERLYRLHLTLPPCQLFRMDDGYHLILQPTCRHFYLLRSLCSEYGTLIGNSSCAAAFTREHGTLLCTDILQRFGPLLTDSQSGESNAQ